MTEFTKYERRRGFYQAWFNSPKTQNTLKGRIIDLQDLLLGADDPAGIYQISFVNKVENLAVIAYIGESKYIKTRILQHLKHWFGDTNLTYLTYHTGLPAGDPNWRIEIRLLAEDERYIERKLREQNYILNNKPFLQDDCDGLFQRYNSPYIGNDLCLHPWNNQRHIAFEHAVNRARSEKAKTEFEEKNE